MGVLAWRWELPSGETLEAKLENGIESAYVGPRLASRSPPGGMPNGHSFAIGEKQAHVTFDRARHKCVLTVDGVEVAPVVAPPEFVLVTTPQAQASADGPAALRVPIPVIAAAAFVVLYLVVVGFHAPGAFISRVGGANTPLNGMHQSPNGMLRSNYPVEFSVISGDRGTLFVGRDGKDAETVYLTVFRAGDASVNAAATELVGNYTKVLAGRGVTYEPGESKPSRCFQKDEGIETTGVVRRDGDEGVLWSCTFLRDGFAYSFSYATLDRVYEDERLLRRTIAATQPVPPRKAFPGVAGLETIGGGAAEGSAAQAPPAEAPTENEP